jgi:hypothetical protein
MRHRRRVHELEAELTRLHAQLDQLLEMPDHGAPSLPVKHIDAEPAISKALPEPVASNGEGQPDRKTSARKRVSLTPAEAGRHEAGLNGLTQKEPSPAAVQEP